MESDNLVMKQTEKMTCTGCYYGQGSGCERPEDKLHCMSDGKEYIYVIATDDVKEV